MIDRIRYTSIHHPLRVTSTPDTPSGSTLIVACNASLAVRSDQPFPWICDAWRRSTPEPSPIDSASFSRSVRTAAKAACPNITPLVIVTPNGVLGVSGTGARRATFEGQARMVGPCFLVDPREAVEMAKAGPIHIEDTSLVVRRELGELRLEGQPLIGRYERAMEILPWMEGVDRVYRSTTRPAVERRPADDYGRIEVKIDDRMTWLNRKFLIEALPTSGDAQLGIGPQWSDTTHVHYRAKGQRVETWISPMRGPV
jgi:hypothetical protein